MDRDEDGFVLESSDSLWILEGGADTDGTTVRGILGEMARLDASGFYEEGDSLSAPRGTIRAMDQEGNVFFRLQMGSGEGDQWLRVDGDSIIYRVGSWRGNRLIPSLEQVEGGG